MFKVFPKNKNCFFLQKKVLNREITAFIKKMLLVKDTTKLNDWLTLKKDNRGDICKVYWPSPVISRLLEC